MEQLHEPRSDGHGNAHDDALTHPADLVLLAVVGGVKEVIGRLLEGGEHQDGLLHLGQSVASDAENLAPVKKVDI